MKLGFKSARFCPVLRRGQHYLCAAFLMTGLWSCQSDEQDDEDAQSEVSETSANATSSDCSGSSDMETVVCAVEAFFNTLSSDELETVQLDWSDASARTVWSNLPNVSRNGLMFGDLTEESLAAALSVAEAALSEDGYADLIGVMAADDYIGSLNGSDTGDTAAPGGPGGPGGFNYGSGYYYLAVFGSPGTSSNWMLQIGGHHLAFNITYIDGVGYPVPHHAGAEPKVSFEVNSTTYAPLAEEGSAMAAMYENLSETELASAYLSGSYSDVVVGPDNGSGVLPTDYPESEGILVSDLSSAQQLLVTNAIAQWVKDYPDDIADALMNDYTSSEAYGKTYISWAGSESSGVDVDVNGTYMRIDGPRLWLEVACQGGVVISDQTHYHTIFRDKLMDYGNSL